jgi:eukaryotic-like serine/threonine-protein kinase
MEPASSRRFDQSSSSPVPFVGREAELRVLHTALGSAFAGRGQVVLIAGEPGIGKTRTSDMFAAQAEASGACILWGRCHEWEGAPPYWPWIQVLRAYLSLADEGSLIRDLGAGAADVAQVLPELRQRIPDLPELPAMEPEQARFRLFDALATFLVNAAKARPLVVVLDDLHWADTPSLLLLQFLAQGIRQPLADACRTVSRATLPADHTARSIAGGYRLIHRSDIWTHAFGSPRRRDPHGNRGESALRG